VKIDLKGKQADGNMLETQVQVTDYLLSEAGLAIVPFYAFGADRQSPWYRLSIGTCKKEEIGEMLGKLEAALQKCAAPVLS
jgi:aspartate aminotransferase